MQDHRLFAGLEKTLLQAFHGGYYPLAKTKTTPPPTERWPSGIAGIDDSIFMRGFYGLSVICGPPKLGKSLLAYQSAICAALNGWRVVYVDAELDDYQAIERLRNATGQQDADTWLSQHPRFVRRQLNDDCSMQTLVEDVVAQLEQDDDRVLVVIDSINSVAEFMVQHRERPTKEQKYIAYFDAIRTLTRWCVAGRRLSEGKVGFLVTSERNRRGGTKGEKLEFACDVLLKMKGKPAEKMVDLTVELSREGGDGGLGKYLRDWQKCRFRIPERVESPDSAKQDPLIDDDWRGSEEPPL